MFDFLSEPLGGYTEQSLEPNVQGPVNQTANSNMSWGQLLGALSQQSNTKGGQQLGGFFDKYKLKTANYPITGGGNAQKESTGLGELVSAVLAFL